MRIGLNLLFLIPGIVGGTETYSTSLIRAIHKLDRENEYYIFINKESKDLDLPEGVNFHRVICPIRSVNRAARFLWEQLALPWQVAYYKLDVLHSLGFISPLVLPCKSVVTIHDMGHVYIPESYTRFTRIVQNFFVTCSARRADRIIAVSEFTKKQIIQHIRGTEDKVCVIHEAPKEQVRAEHPTAWPNLQKKYALYKPYIFAFSSIAPHKNIPRLIEAFAQLRQQGLDSLLVIAGHHSPKEPSLLRVVDSMGLGENEVIFTGYLPDQDISLLLSHATVFAFPSLYEGFGLPALEAMAAGTVVACSTSASLPEIAGDAAEYFDPTRIDQMAQVLYKLLKDESKRQCLKERSILNLQRFSWKKAAGLTLSIYTSPQVLPDFIEEIK